MRRLNLTLTDEAYRVLEEQGERSRSAYVSALLVSSQRIWIAALSTLRLHGWGDLAIRAGCEAVNGAWALSCPPSYLVRLLEDYPLDAESGVDVERWRACIAEVRVVPIVATALRDLAIEYWRGGRELRATLDHLRPRGVTSCEESAPSS